MNNMMRVLAIFLLAAGLAAPATAAPKARAAARLIGLNGKPMGRASFQQTSHGVLIEIELRGLQPGAHAIMIHTTASCDPKTRFTSAGPVFSIIPSRPHGYFAKGGPRTGNLPNQFAAADGTLHASMIANAFTLGNGKKSIFDRDGASIIVHERADDYTTQPDGNAGPRLACGTIIRTAGPRKGASHHAHK